MPITVKLSGGVEIHVGDADFATFLDAFRIALADSTPLEIRVSDSKTVVLNPHNVLYFEAPSEAAAIANGNGLEAATAAAPAH